MHLSYGYRQDLSAPRTNPTAPGRKVAEGGGRQRTPGAGCTLEGQARAPVGGDAANPWRGTWISRRSWVSVFEFGFRLSSWIKAGSPTRHLQINDLHFLKKNSLF